MHNAKNLCPLTARIIYHYSSLEEDHSEGDWATKREHYFLFDNFSETSCDNFTVGCHFVRRDFRSLCWASGHPPAEAGWTSQICIRYTENLT